MKKLLGTLGLVGLLLAGQVNSEDFLRVKLSGEFRGARKEGYCDVYLREGNSSLNSLPPVMGVEIDGYVVSGDKKYQSYFRAGEEDVYVRFDANATTLGEISNCVFSVVYTGKKEDLKVVGNLNGVSFNQTIGGGNVCSNEVGRGEFGFGVTSLGSLKISPGRGTVVRFN